MTTHRCLIKYIELNKFAAENDKACLHATKDFEMHKAVVEHSDFDNLHDAVFSHCPVEYRCIEPIALRHEVLWSVGLNVLYDANGNRIFERDQLRHAIERDEYDELKWTMPDGEMLSLCVDVVSVDENVTEDTARVVTEDTARVVTEDTARVVMG